MTTETIRNNATALQKEIKWFFSILNERTQEGAEKTLPELQQSCPVPALEAGSPYANMLQQNQFSYEERFTFVLALIPHLRPEMLDVLLQKNQLTQQGYTQFGGVQGKSHGGFLPTGETAMFLLAGSNLESKITLLALFDRDSKLSQSGLLLMEGAVSGEPVQSGMLVIPDEVVDKITTGLVRKPKFSSEFPAKNISTNMDWDDLILHGKTKQMVLEIEAWITHNSTLMNEWGMKKRLKPGYNALFYGPPGTGKSLTAALLGKRTNRDVYRIDLSRVVSKYIGETEKNLAKVFDKAEHKQWILFFDEADALFGKRTSISDSHDRYANQEVSYLLQRIEDYNGLTVLATNLKNNIDTAFLRRFQSIIHFPMPGANERERLWASCFPEKCTLEEKIDLREISRNYEMTGGSIINAVGYSSLMALKNGNNTIRLQDLMVGIKKEYSKEGRTV